MSAKNLVEAKKVVKTLLKRELSEKHITSKNICSDTAFLKSDRTFCLVKYIDKIYDDLSIVLPDISQKIDWNRYVRLEKHVFNKYLDELSNLKKKYPIRGTVIFVIQTGEIYMTSPYILYGLDNEYGLSITEGNKETLCFPTVFLSVPEGLNKPRDEIEAQKRLSLITQINSISSEYEENYYDDTDFDDEDEDFYWPLIKNDKNSFLDEDSRFSELFPDEMRNVALNLLYEMSMSLKELSKEIKSIKKTLKEK